MMAVFRPCCVIVYLFLFCLSVSGFTTTNKKPLVPTPTSTPTLTLRTNTRRFAQESDPQNDDYDTTTTKPLSSSSKQPTMDPYIEIQTESYFDGTKPDSSWNLARNNFCRQGVSLVKQGLEQIGICKVDKLRPPACLNLHLSNDAVTQAYVDRIESGGGVNNTHPVSQVLYDVGCFLLDGLFDERPIQRFWFLETIARIPYFSYISMLHLYESFG